MILSVAVIHNILYLGFTSFLDIYEYPVSPIILILGSSLYTAVIGSILHILKGE
jgi:hypothetical protein